MGLAPPAEVYSALFLLVGTPLLTQPPEALAVAVAHLERDGLRDH
jgi:hypothetical protein